MKMNVDQRGPAGAPTLVLGHALGADMRMWSPQAEALSDRYRVVRVDFRGHGGTPPTAGAEFSQLADDLAELIEEHRFGTVHYVGCSMGGIAGMYLALRRPDLLRSLTLACTRCKANANAKQHAAKRRELVMREGVTAIVDSTVNNWFRPDSKAAYPLDVAAVRDALSNVSRDVYLDILDGLNSFDLSGHITGIELPCLVIGGRHDPAGDEVTFIHGQIGGSRLIWFERSAHLPNIEERDSFNDAIRSHVDEVEQK